VDDGRNEHLRWVVAEPGAASAELARQLGIPEPIARLLLCRGYVEPGAARAFLVPSLDALHDPMRLTGMATAVARLRAALAAGEPILIYGDYDVDGTVATVLLKTAAERAAAAMGVTADVRYHIPHRIREGYGMQESRIAEAATEGVRLVISVDTGIRGFAAAAEARRLGLDLIVTDHHLPDAAAMPAAFAVLNPNQPGCDYPCKELCGAGVAFKLAQALLESVATTAGERMRLREKTLPSFLKLLAIATIADAVPLTGENRVIAAIGLRELARPSQPGLRALMELAGIEFGGEDVGVSAGVSAMDVGFRLAPRINAAGRMDIGKDVVELFLERDPAVARELAAKLHRLNDERRATEAEALRAIEAQLAALATTGLPDCVVLDDAGAARGWHRGVIGILASRVVDRTGRPALVITHEDGQAYGSGRSVAGFHLLDALSAAHLHNGDAAQPGGLLTRFGGHAHAVGFSLPSADVPRLRERLQRIAGSPVTATAAELACDGELRLDEITPALLDALQQLAPFGIGNAEPVFVSFDVRLARPVKPVGERHLRLWVEEAAEGARFDAIAWGRRTDWAALARAQQWQQGSRLDLAYRLRRNRRPEFGGWEMEIVDMRTAMSTAMRTAVPRD